MTIGLYDIDLYHGKNFALSLPLMKVYNYLFKNNQQVIMMRKNEKTERYNKVFYFKSLPTTSLPKNFKIDLDKGQLLGYGFYKNSGITNPETIKTPPSFTPYELVKDKMKGSLYKKVRNHSVIDWREKDFTGDKLNDTVFVNDADYSSEEDWEDLFTYYKDRRLFFVYPFFCQDFSQLNNVRNLLENKKIDINIVAPDTKNLQELLHYAKFEEVFLNNYNFNEEDLFKIIFASKVLGIKLKFISQKSQKIFGTNLIKWNTQPIEMSFKDYLQDKFKDSDYYNFKYSHLLKQKPNFLDKKDLISLNII